MRVDDGANPAFGWSSGRRGPPESDVTPIEEEEEDDDDVKAIQRLCDLTERIEKARDANQFRVAMELMREQLGLFETRATLSEEERKMMEPLIQTVLGDIEEMRGKARREGEKEESKEKNAGGFTAAALPQTKTTTKTTPVPKAEEARSNTLVEVDKNIVLTSVISPTTKPATGGAPPAARRSARGEKQEDNNNNNNNNNENRNKTTTNVLETKAAWGIPAGDEEEENKEEEEEFFRAVDVAKQQKHQEEQKKSYGDLKKEKEAREQKEKEEERNKPITENAKTFFKVLDKNSNCSLIEMKPITGRKHQLRKQLSSIGHPIYGDHKYNFGVKKIGSNKNLMLHAYQIKFMIKDKKYSYTALLPDYFKKLLKVKKLNFSNY